MGDIVKIIFLPFIALMQLILEVFAALSVYAYLNTFHRATFGSFTKSAGSILNSIEQTLNSILTPTTANTAYASVLGDLTAKAMLLLLIGLTVSAILRMIAWVVKLLMHKS